MEHIYGVRTAEELEKYQAFVRKIQPWLDAYMTFLKNEYALMELPRAILWTDGHTATKLISDIPVPAYTNDYRVVMTPDLETWREIYLRQLDGLTGVEEIRDYYNHRLSERHVMQILGHELAHHSEFFLDSDYEKGIWFEEGMVEYISRRYFLTEDEFQAETEINRKLVGMLKERLGNQSLEKFGQTTYDNDYTSIFFEYWRSFLAVNKIIEEHNGDVHAVFRSYHAWHEQNNGQTLTQWFQVTI